MAPRRRVDGLTYCPRHTKDAAPVPGEYCPLHMSKVMLILGKDSTTLSLPFYRLIFHHVYQMQGICENRQVSGDHGC
jgi:hypothetical protein